jgi:hypothetical protein
LRRGWFSIELACGLGIDYRPHHVTSSKLIAERLGVKLVEFVDNNIETMPPSANMSPRISLSIDGS